MNKFKFVVAGLVLAFSATANSASPYIGQEDRNIKTLSQQEVDDYLNGKGLGYAKAAELNHFPGPSHVLETAKELNLTQEQIAKTQAIFDAMKQKASTLGNLYVQKERLLDQQFATGAIDAESLKMALSDIAQIQSEIRYVHLNAHLEQRALLSNHQVHMYDQLRGYGENTENQHKHNKHHH